MSKMSDLQAQLDRAAGRSAITPADLPPPATVTAPHKSAPIGVYVAPSRVGRVHIGAHLPSDFKRSLRLVQAQTGEDMQTLLGRALNDLFRSCNLPVIELGPEE
jgi:hypothetical protein